MKLVKTCFVAALAAGATLATNAEDVRVPNRITLIHSHNDYAQERPFWGAYEAGADSIEADVYLVDGDLLVAHTRKELKKENTLRRLYLEPLREVMRKNGGRARADGKPLQLMVDIKSGKAALDRLLEIVEQENLALDRRLQEGWSAEELEALARERLGLVLPGDRIFRFSSNVPAPQP